MLAVSIGALLLVLPIALVAGEHGTTKVGNVGTSQRINDPFSNDYLASVGPGQVCHYLPFFPDPCTRAVFSLAGQGWVGPTSCQNVTVVLPGHCLAAALTGGAVFDVKDFNLGGKMQSVVQGKLVVKVFTCTTCGGLEVTVAVDRDFDSFVTNVDAIDDDVAYDHGTNPNFDDQWYGGSFSGWVRPGDTLEVPFCFAHHVVETWDQIYVFLDTPLHAPTIGLAAMTLTDVAKVGDHLSDCGTFSSVCNDGVDNDGDGDTDYPADAGCSSSSDNDECNDIDKTTHAVIDTVGSGYGTTVDILLEWSYNGPSCAGGPTIKTYHWSCLEAAGSGWSDTACYDDMSLGYPQIYGTFSCGTSTCSGAVSPHTISAGISPDDNGGIACVYSYPMTISSSNIQTHCHPH